MDIETARGYAKNAFAQEINTIHRAYIDMAGDLIAGILFSQIMYWFEPSKNGQSKIRVKKKDGYWLAKSREDWYQEVRISPKQYDRAIKILKDKGLVELSLHRFNGSPTVHVRPNMEVYNQLLDEWIENRASEYCKLEADKLENIPFLPKGQIPISPKGDLQIDETGNSITETTTNTTNQKILNKENKECHSLQNDTSVFPKDLEEKAGRWSWKSDKEYLDYIQKVLPKYIREIASEYKESDRAYKVLLGVVTDYFKMYRSYNGKYHPWYKKETLAEVIDELHEFFGSISWKETEGYMEQFFSHDKLRSKPLKVFSSYNMLEELRKELDEDWN